MFRFIITAALAVTASVATASTACTGSLYPGLLYALSGAFFLIVTRLLILLTLIFFGFFSNRFGQFNFTKNL